MDPMPNVLTAAEAGAADEAAPAGVLDVPVATREEEEEDEAEDLPEVEAPVELAPEV